MDQTEVLKEFEDANAILTGHFILTSGLRSDTYLQCARALMDPKRAERLCAALAQKVKDTLGENAIDLVVSPAMGGVIVGYELARQLGVPSIFCERVDGTFTFRRGFTIEENARILIVEDVITTGKSSIETVECISQYHGKVVGEACLIDRSGGDSASVGIPIVSLAELDIKTYEPDGLPDDLQAVPAVKPGSRGIRSQ